MISDFNVNSFFLPANLSIDSAVMLQDERVALERRRVEQQRRTTLEEKASQATAEPQREPDFYSTTDFDLIQPIDEWIESNCYDIRTVDPVKLDFWRGRKIRLEDHQRRILRHIFKPHGDQLSKYTTIIWSEPKKSGKTQIASCVLSYFSLNVDPPNNVLAIANTKDQATGRIYRGALPTLAGLGADIHTARTSKPVVLMPNGTNVRALPNNPASEAGDFYCATFWSEIWGFKSQEDEKFYAELMPVETMRVSMRWIETYAGYIDESTTLKRLFLKAFTDFDERELAEGARFVPELEDIRTDNRPACIEVPEEELFIYWSHERRMPWQTETKRKKAQRDLPKVEYVRLIENRWQSSSSEMLEEAWIQASVRPRELDKYKGMKLTLAVDAAKKHDNIALVGTFKKGEIYYTPLIEIYDPKGVDADLYATVEQRVKALWDEDVLARYFDEEADDGNGRWITPVYFDPYQLHQIRLNCIEYGIDVIEFDQGRLREKADTMLYELYRDSKIVNPDRADFIEHLRGGKAKYLEGERLRIQKGTTVNAKKIDALVAQSMSCYGSFLYDKTKLEEEDTSSVLAQGSISGWGFGGGASNE